MSRRPPNVLAITMTVFLDILSFGLFIPDLQLRGEKLVNRLALPEGSMTIGLIIGLTLALFSIAQLLTSPILGRMSDRIGRRKILLVTTSMAVLAGLAYTQADSLWILAGARVLMGFAAGNISVAYAYISDVTKPEDRAAAMGKLGIAFGLGFILGPPVGGYLIGLGGESPVLLGLAAAAMALVNFAYVFRFLPESLKLPRDAPSADRIGMAESLRTALRLPGLGYLLILFFAVNFAMSNMESTYFRMAHDVFDLSEFHTALILTEVGVVMAIVQGGFIRPLVAKFGETALVRVGYFLMAPALALMPWAPPWTWALCVAGLLAVGSGLSSPSLSSLISRAAPAAIVGGVFGLTQALGALARIAGPLIGNSLYQRSPWIPYALAGALMLVPIVMALRVRQPVDRAREA
ncbi:MAG: MFS transporter [Armatimonadetes bacterium]|nr:MFS transporter [Armatimonadota bacterium]